MNLWGSDGLGWNTAWMESVGGQKDTCNSFDNKNLFIIIINKNGACIYCSVVNKESSECTPKQLAKVGGESCIYCCKQKSVPKACTAPTSSSEERSREETVGTEQECFRTKPLRARIFTAERWTKIRKHKRSECKDWIFFLVQWKDSSSLVRGMKCPQCAGQQRAIILSHPHTVLKVANRTAEAQGTT